MEIINRLGEKTEKNKGCVIAMGTFDGLHRGHMEVILSAKKYAEKHGLLTAVLTFSNHPYVCIDPENIPPCLMTEEEKVLFLEQAGVDLLINLPFDREFAALSPEEFLQGLEQYNFKALSVGENFSYGCMGRGNSKTLREAGRKSGFDVLVSPLFQVDGITVSSSCIRLAITEGQFDLAEKFLGRPYFVTGEVVHGKKRGRLLGFPTANIAVDRRIEALPAGGVYAAEVYMEENIYPAMVNLGKNPTFGDIKRELLESHLIAFSGNLYGKNLKVRFRKFIRSEKKFSDIKALISEMEADKKICLQLLR